MRALRLDTYEHTLQTRARAGFMNASLSVLPEELLELQAALCTSGFTVMIELESPRLVRLRVCWETTAEAPRVAAKRGESSPPQ
jgi:hypothetical protein